MRVSRREFMKYAGASAGALGLSASGLLRLEQAVAGPGDPPVIWLQGQSCTGCSVSFLNSVHYGTADQLLTGTISLEYHPNVMASAGDLAISAAEMAKPSMEQLNDFSRDWLKETGQSTLDLNGDGIVNFLDYALARRQYILAVEGAIPTGAEGRFCHVGGHMTMLEAFTIFARRAQAILAIGTCAAYGGLPAGPGNPTGAQGVGATLNGLGMSKPLVNIPGCPSHPDWIVGTIAYMLVHGSAPTLDSYGRPRDYFPNDTIHKNCPVKGTGEADVLGEGGCLKELGCRGPNTHADCHIRRWNSGGAGENGVSWCIGGRAPCHGCTEPNFPGTNDFIKWEDSD